MKKITTILLLILLITFWGCNKTAKNNVPAIDPQNMDLTIKPGDDFFQYANGNWIKNNPIPDEYSRYGAFEQLLEENYVSLRLIMDNAAANKNAAKGSPDQKIGDFYATAMDTVKIEALGITPLETELTAIDALTSVDDVMSYTAHLEKIGIPALFHVFAAQDDKNTESVIVQLYQGGLGLPDRDYYLSDDGRSKEIRTEYKKHLLKMFELMGNADTAAQQADVIMDMETRLAQASMTRLDCRDPQKTYNKMTLAELTSLSPNINWQTWFSEIGLDNSGDININQPEFFKYLGKMAGDVGVDQWKTFLKWNLVNNSAGYLSSAFVDQDFYFYGTVLSGTEVNKTRWKRMLEATNNALGEAVGQVYVKKYFPPEAKTRMLTLVGNLKTVLGERIQNLDWMSDVTKKRALDKLAAMKLKIGYPDKWIDYSALEINRDSFLGNVWRANEFEFNRQMNKVGKPVDRTEWEMYPQTVNAYYHPLMNEIVFPAGILQPPFFYLQADDAVNYGAIGVVIGHEMTHGFDDQGRQFDEAGNLNDWWTEEDSKLFDERAKVIADQFDNFVVLDSLNVNGKLTLGENIADLGGLNIAMAAYKKTLEGKPEPAPVDNLTDMQRFYISYAQLWRQNIRPQELMRRIKEDVHSPGEFRVNGPITNIADFYQAFSISPEDKLYRAEESRAKIW